MNERDSTAAPTGAPEPVDRHVPASLAGRKIAVPYADDIALLNSFRGWVVQEDGRNKPFDTFCREAVRSIAGRERFEMVRSMTTGHVLAIDGGYLAQ